MNLNLDIKWLIIIALTTYVILLQQCGGGSGECPEAVVTTKTVTSLVKGTADTVFVEIEKPIYIEVNIPVPTTVTVPTAEGDITVNEYTTEITDSLIKGAITSKVDGVLVSQEFNYVPMFPKYINRVDTVIIDNTEIKVQKHSYIGIGGILGGSPNTINLMPTITYSTKNNYIYSYSYGLFDKTHNIGIIKKFNAKEIFNKKKLARAVIN